MMEGDADPASASPAETVLCEELGHGDAMLGTIAPILRHLIAHDDQSVFGDEIIARVRGMAADVSCQLLDELALAGSPDEVWSHGTLDADALTAALAGISAFLGHAHALALEWQLTERLQTRLHLDPVLSPLLQALIESSDAGTSGLSMNLLASQSRFCQSQRRMKLPLAELPGDLLHGALLALRTIAGTDPETDRCAAAAEAAIRARYDEGASRLGLISRLVTGMGGGAVAALSAGHAGVAIFLTALSLASGQDRDLATLCTNESQVARLALALRAAGLKPKTIEEQFLALHPEVALPEGFDGLGADRAAAILAVSGGYPGA